jgi:hypothetical protein
LTVAVAGVGLGILKHVDEDFDSRVVEPENAHFSGRKVRDRVCAVDHSDDIDLLIDLVGKNLVSDSWLTESVEKEVNLLSLVIEVD